MVVKVGLRLLTAIKNYQKLGISMGCFASPPLPISTCFTTIKDTVGNQITDLQITSELHTFTYPNTGPFFNP